MSSSLIPSAPFRTSSSRIDGVEARYACGAIRQRRSCARGVAQPEAQRPGRRSMNPKTPTPSTAGRIHLVAGDLLDLEVLADSSLEPLGARSPRASGGCRRSSARDPPARRGTSACSGAGRRRRSRRRRCGRSRSGGGRRRSRARRRRGSAATASWTVGSGDSPDAVDGALRRPSPRPRVRPRGGARSRPRRCRGCSAKIGERLWRVARVRRRRSSFGPGWVRSWGRTRPGP